MAENMDGEASMDIPDHLNSEIERWMGDDNSVDWRNRHRLWQEKMCFLYRNQIGCDIKIKVSDGDEHKIYQAHRFVLEMSSEFFAAMMKGNFKEASLDTIQIKEVNVDVFGLFLEFLYCKIVQLTSIKEAIELYRIADIFMINDLKDHCLFYIESHIDSDSVIDCLRFSEVFKLTNLSDICYFKLQRHTKSVLFFTNIEEVDVDFLQRLLSLNSLSVSEVELFSYIEHWILLKRESKDEDYIQGLIKSLMPKMSFLNMTPKEFIEGPGKSKMLTEGQCLGILAHLASENSPWPYPEGFRTHKRHSVDQTCGVIPQYVGEISEIKLVPKQIESFDLGALYFQFDRDVELIGVTFLTSTDFRDMSYEEEFFLRINDHTKVIRDNEFKGTVDGNSTFFLHFNKTARLKRWVKYRMYLQVKTKKNYNLSSFAGHKYCVNETNVQFCSQPGYSSMLPIYMIKFRE